MIKTKFLGAVMAALILVAWVGCSKKEPTANESQGTAAPAQQAAAPVDKATVGSITGAAKFDGAKPKPTKIDMSQDAACAKKGENTVEAVSGDGDNLGNVFVYVKEGLGSRTFDPPSQPVVLDQE